MSAHRSTGSITLHLYIYIYIYIYIYMLGIHVYGCITKKEQTIASHEIGSFKVMTDTDRFIYAKMQKSTMRSEGLRARHMSEVLFFEDRREHLESGDFAPCVGTRFVCVHVLLWAVTAVCDCACVSMRVFRQKINAEKHVICVRMQSSSAYAHACCCVFVHLCIHVPIT
jgi:hypothetical protein